MSGLTKPLVRTADRRRTRRRWLIAAAAAALLAGTAIAVQMATPKVATVAALETTVLERGTIQDSISATGTVASATTFKVYSTLTYSVRTVHVSVGDAVSKGDRLCQLDTSGLNKQIASKEASIEQSEATSAAAIRTARDKYDAAVKAARTGTNPSVVSAQSAVTNAHNAWIKAKKTYDDYDSTLDDDENSQVLSAKAALDNAANALASARYTYDQAKDDLSTARAALDSASSAFDLAQAEVDAAGSSVTQAQLDALAAASQARDTAQQAVDGAEDVAAKARLGLESAHTTHENAEDAYEAASTAADNTLSDYKLAVQSSYDSYRSALAALAAANATAATEIQLNLDGLRSSQASAGNAVAIQDLVNIEKDVESTTVKAPVSGTVTAVYAEVGANPAGVIFVIEDTERLVIDASVNEYDVGSVKPGVPVAIESDATRDAVYRGTVASVAPTSDKDPSGETITGTDIQYATKVDVLSSDTQLRIGMNVRLRYLIAEEADVLVVPYEAVFTNAMGTKSVLAAVPRPDGTYELRSLTVTTGLENDLSVVIAGDGITPGLRVLNTPTKYAAGSVVRIAG